MFYSWLPVVGMLILHFVLAVPGVLLAVEYWYDEAPGAKPHRTIYLFIQAMLGIYTGLWMLGLIAELIGLGNGVSVAEITGCVVLVPLLLFLACLGFATRVEHRLKGLD